jgi:Zn-finger nucleic acid-binding protein
MRGQWLEREISEDPGRAEPVRNASRWPDMSTLTCPKCGSDMRNYERNQVHVDQCTGCGGLFLDRGELEALVAAENAWHQAPAQQEPAQPQQAPQQASHQPAPQQNAWQQPPAQSYQAPYRATSKAPYGGQYGHGQHRKKSFLSELFD